MAVYVPNYGGNWQTGVGGGTPITEAALDNLETQYTKALQEQTREFFAIGVYGAGGSTVANTGDHAGYVMNGAGQTVHIEFMIPSDFSSVTSAILVGIVLAADQGVGLPMRVDLDSDYGVLDEAYNNTSEAAANENSIEGTSTVSDLISWDITGVMAAITALDYFGLKISYNAGAGGTHNETNARLLGVFIDYA